MQLTEPETEILQAFAGKPYAIAGFPEDCKGPIDGLMAYGLITWSGLQRPIPGQDESWWRVRLTDQGRRYVLDAGW